tara:strand:+ start:586 stop:762 length:177 start_codon:yes stop_codon:yes gene_type:complete
MMNDYEKKVYGGKNYINAMITLSHEERSELEKISRKMKHKTINLTIEKLLKKAIRGES